MTDLTNNGPLPPRPAHQDMAQAAVSRFEPPPSLQSVPGADHDARNLRLLTLFISVLWLSGLAAYLWGFFGAMLFQPQPFGVTLGIIGIALIPVLLIAVLIELAIQGRALARSHRQLARLTLVANDGHNDPRAALLSGGVRRELDKLSGALDQTLARVAAIEAMIENQIGAVERVGGRAQLRAQAISDLLKQERDRLETISTELSTNTTALVQALSNETGRVRAANELATREIQDAEGMLGRQMQSFKAMAEDASRAAQERTASLEGAAAKLESLIETSLKNADALTSRLGAQHALMAESAKRMDDERGRLERALEAQNQLLRAIGSTPQISISLESAIAASALKVNEALSAIEQRSAEAGRQLRFEVDGARDAGASAAKAITDATTAALDASSRMRQTLKGEIAALSDDVSNNLKTLDGATGNVGKTLNEASQNAGKLILSLEDTLKMVETASRRLFTLLDQIGNRSLTAQNAIDSASSAMEERLGQVPEMAAEHANRLSALLEDQAQRMGALADSLSRRAQGPAVPTVTPIDRPRPLALPPEPETSDKDEPEVAALHYHARALDEPSSASSNARESHKDTGLGAIPWIGRRLRRTAVAKAIPTFEPEDSITQDLSAMNANGTANGGTGGFWSTLFARIDGEDPRAPIVPPGAHNGFGEIDPTSNSVRAQRTFDSLYALAFDIDRLLEEDPPMDLYKRYQNGEPDAYARRLLALKNSGVEQRIRHKYRDDIEFRDRANRYRQRFIELANVTTNGASPALFASPAGRLFTMLDEALRPLG